MAIWTAEIKEIEKLYESLIGQFPDLEKELDQLIRAEDVNVIMLYSRRCLEVIITDLCECELKRPRKTEPLKGIIDKLHKEEKVPSHIITSMHGMNELSTYGTHPKDFDPEQVKPVLNNLSIVIKWYLKYRESRVDETQKDDRGKTEFIRETSTEKEIRRPKRNQTILRIVLLLVVFAVVGVTIIYFVKKQSNNFTNLEKSIAVLPFRNDSSDDSTTIFMDGVMEEILTKLQTIKDLRVISRTSVEQYRNHTKTIPEIAKELGVNYVVEGSGQKSGNLFRLRVQLIKAAKKESHLWAKPFEQENINAKDYFKMQTQIAEAIATELQAVITPQENQLIKRIPTENLDAYEAYLKGQFYWRKLTPNDLKTAMQYFELAKEIDPNYALAYAGISDVWIALQQMGLAPPDEAGPKAMAAIMKAQELDSTLAQVHYSLALVRYASEWDWEEGESEFQKTFAINPNHAEARAYYSHLLNIVGRPKEAMEQIELAIKLDPHNPLLKSLYGADLLFVHRFDEAISVIREALKMDPTNPVALNILAMALHLIGRYEEELEPWKSYYINTYKDVVHVFDKGYAKAGYVGAQSLEADTLVAQSKTNFVLPMDIAIPYTLIGNKELALEWMENAYDVHDPNLPYLLLPIFDNLRNEPRFQDLARRMNIPYK